MKPNPQSTALHLKHIHTGCAVTACNVLDKNNEGGECAYKVQQLISLEIYDVMMCSFAGAASKLILCNVINLP